MFKRHRLLLAFFLVFSLAGCKHLSEEAKGILKYTATSAKERATSWEWVRSWVISKDEKQAGAAAIFCAKHAENLNAQAKGLDDLYQAAQAGSNFSEQIRLKLRDQALVSRATAEIFSMAAESLTVKAEAPKDWTSFCNDHNAGLKDLTESLAALSSLAPPKEAKPVVKPVAIP